MNFFNKYSLYFAWTISLVAMLGSLYYGEILQFEPCRLCWYQRIAMFPLVLFLGIAFTKGEPKIAWYCLPLVGIGILFASYQSMIQIVPSLQIHALCGAGGHCTTAGVAPYFSLLAFLLIGALILKNKF